MKSINQSYGFGVNPKYNDDLNYSENGFYVYSSVCSGNLPGKNVNQYI